MLTWVKGGSNTTKHFQPILSMNVKKHNFCQHQRSVASLASLAFLCKNGDDRQENNSYESQDINPWHENNRMAVKKAQMLGIIRPLINYLKKYKHIKIKNTVWNLNAIMETDKCTMKG